MKRQLRLFGFLVAVLTATPAIAGIDPASPTIIIRLYNNFGVGKPEMERARQEADAVLTDAGVAASWVTCRQAGKPREKTTVACDEVLRRDEVMVRVLGGGEDDPEHSLGYSYVDAKSGAGALSTVYATRVRSMAEGTGVNVGVLLGRVIAHEVVHLLFGNTTHSADGLMRAHWTKQSLRRNSIDEWRLSAAESRLLQGAIVARARGQAAPSNLLSRAESR